MVEPLRPDRRRNPRGERSVNLVDLSQRHHEMLNAMALGEGNQAIAERFGVTSGWTSCVRNSDLGKMRLEEIRSARNAQIEQVLTEVAELAPKAIDVYRQIITGEEASLALKLRAAQQVMQHPLITPKQPDEVHQHLHVHQERVLELRERGLKIAREMGLVAKEEVSDARET